MIFFILSNFLQYLFLLTRNCHSVQPVCRRFFVPFFWNILLHCPQVLFRSVSALSAAFSMLSLSVSQPLPASLALFLLQKRWYWVVITPLLSCNIYDIVLRNDRFYLMKAVLLSWNMVFLSENFADNSWYSDNCGLLVFARWLTLLREFLTHNPSWMPFDRFLFDFSICPSLCLSWASCVGVSWLSWKC